MVHAEFEHAVGCIGVHAGQGERHPPLIVQISHGGVGRTAGAERGGQPILGAGFADGSGYAHELRRRAVAREPSQRGQGGIAIVDRDQIRRPLQTCRNSAYNGACGAGGQRRGDIVVPVEVGPGERHE